MWSDAFTIIMAVKTSGCPDILYNDWVTKVLTIKILVPKKKDPDRNWVFKLFAIHKILNLNTKTSVNHRGNT